MITSSGNHHKTSPSKGLDDGLHVLFWNAGGLDSAKFTELKTLIHKSNADVYIVVEAGASTDSPEFFHTATFTNYILKRSRQVASGIVVGVKNNLACKFEVLHRMTETDKHEAVLIEVWVNGRFYKIIGVYNPPNNNLSTSLIETSSRHRNSIILGDFNAHSPLWNYSGRNAPGHAMESLIDTTQLINLRSEPTFLSFGGSTSTPDLCLVHANLMNRCQLSLKDPVEGCGHRTLLLRVRPKSNNAKKLRLPRWNFKRANWTAFERTSDELLTPDIINDNPDQSVAAFEANILETAKKCIPRGYAKKYKPFWNENLSNLQRERNKARKRAETTNNLADCAEL